MHDAYDEERRAPIRRALDDYLKKMVMSAKQLGDAIKKQPDRYKPSVSAATIRRFLNPDHGNSKMVGHKRVATLELYLIDMDVPLPAPAREERPAAANRTADIFPALRGFFQMNDGEAAPYREKIKGDWAFYAYSERGKARVCRGAIRFNGDFCAYEVQESTPAGGDKLYREEQTGHFLFQKNSLIVMLNNKARPISKFYILSIESYENDDGEKEVMTGALVKVGEHKDVFTGIVHMVRRAAAFQQCAMLPRAKVEPEILDYLDSHEWLSPDVQQPLSQLPRPSGAAVPD